MLTPGADPVRKISIIPRTMSLGVTVSAPESDRFNYDRRALLARIEVTTAGRAAEEVVYGDETTGAENDIRQATQLARSMVGRFGMSEEIGFVAVLPQDGDGYGMYGASQVSERTRQRVDDEVKRVVEEGTRRGDPARHREPEPPGRDRGGAASRRDARSAAGVRRRWARSSPRGRGRTCRGRNAGRDLTPAFSAYTRAHERARLARAGPALRA
jgi:Peptidase family M41